MNWSKFGVMTMVAAMGLTVHAEVKVLIAGDSTVENVNPSSGDRKGWGQVIDQSFTPEVKVINLAVGGRSTKTFIQEKRWEKLLSQTKPGDFILMQFGHNDSHGKGKPESTDANTDYQEYLRTYADDAAKAGAKLILVTPPHRRQFQKDGKITQELLVYSDAMKTVAKEKSLPVVDLYAMTGDAMQQLGDDGCRPLYCSDTDRTHFSSKGAEWLAKLIADDLKRQNLPLAAYCRTK